MRHCGNRRLRPCNLSFVAVRQVSQVKDHGLNGRRDLEIGQLLQKGFVPCMDQGHGLVPIARLEQCPRMLDGFDLVVKADHFASQTHAFGEPERIPSATDCGVDHAISWFQHPSMQDLGKFEDRRQHGRVRSVAGIDPVDPNGNRG